MHPLHEVYTDAVAQAEGGKGQHRHGLGRGFYEQQWLDVCHRHGTGFLTGQAVKKLNEAAELKGSLTVEAWEKEMLGALNYCAMAILYRRRYEATEEH